MFAARQGFNYTQDTGPVINFPANSIVPYYGTTIPALADWTLMTAGTNFYIAGTTDPLKLGTTTASRSASVNIQTTSSAGAHTGATNFISGAQNKTGSNLNTGTNLLAGSHAHSVSGRSITVTPSKASVRLLEANKATPTIPAGALGFRNSVTGSYGTRLYSSGYASYLMNGTTGGSISNPSGTWTASTSTGSAGSHQHNGNTNLFYTASPNVYPTALAAGTHSHTLTLSMYQTIMSDTKVLSAWTSASARTAATDVIVMYRGALANLTGTGWFLCDGTNGTINMNDYFAGIAGIGANWGQIYSSDARMNSVTIGDGSTASHGHQNGSLGGSGIYAYHTTETWQHYHTVTYDTFLDFIGTKYYLYFIQYKG